LLLFLSACVLLLGPSFAKADDPAPPAPPPPPTQVVEVQHRVEKGLLKPLADQDKNYSMFSRMRPPPRERRVRVTQSTPTVDQAGRAFMTFAVDARWGTEAWHENDITGCAYVSSGDLYVKIGDEFRGAAYLVGKKADPVAGVCVKAS